MVTFIHKPVIAVKNSFTAFQLFAQVIFVLGILISCNDSSQKPVQGHVIDPPSGRSCFVFKTDKDSVLLQLNFKGNEFNGKLEYHYFEKDQNKGTLIGKMNGDTLFAEYKFMSEGTESYREVAFLKSGNDLVEGYGEVEEKNNKMAFKNKSSLSFTSKNILKQIDCKQDGYQ